MSDVTTARVRALLDSGKLRWMPRMHLLGATVPETYPWSPRQPTVAVHPVTVTSVDREGRPWGQFSRVDGRGGGWGSFSDGWPDIDDPATLGCIEHVLLPEVWGPTAQIQTHWAGSSGSVYIHTTDDDGSVVERLAVENVPKAEALIAALEAAPERGES